MEDKFLLFVDNKANKRRPFYLASFIVVSALGFFTLVTGEWSIFPEPFEAYEQEVPITQVTKPASLPIKSEPTPTKHYDIHIESGMNLAHIFRSLGLPYQTLHEILLLPDVKTLERLQPGQKIHFETHGSELIKLEYHISHTETLHIAKTDEGFKATVETSTFEKRIRYTSGVIDHSLVHSGQKVGLSEKVMLDIARIFSWEINFTKDIKPGDKFTVIHEDHYVSNDHIGFGHIVAVEFVTKGKTYQAYRFTDSRGITDYYHEDGTTLEKPFLKVPLKYSRISSGFNERRKHPILGIVRPHTGIDYVATVGTPIKAIGDGRVTFVGRKGGYGRTVMIDHGQAYSSLYAHLSRYGKLIRKGTKINRGEVIGYVGSSGQATGAHLHFEIRIKNKPVNPKTVKLPTNRKLSQKDLRAFRKAITPITKQLALFRNSEQMTT